MNKFPFGSYDPLHFLLTIINQVKRDVDSSTTHLVAARLGTAKVNDARRQPNVAIVTPDWLWACAERY